MCTPGPPSGSGAPSALPPLRESSHQRRGHEVVVAAGMDGTVPDDDARQQERGESDDT